MCTNFLASSSLKISTNFYAFLCCFFHFPTFHPANINFSPHILTSLSFTNSTCPNKLALFSRLIPAKRLTLPHGHGHGRQLAVGHQVQRVDAGTAPQRSNAQQLVVGLARRFSHQRDQPQRPRREQPQLLRQPEKVLCRYPLLPQPAAIASASHEVCVGTGCALEHR
jgi:hypothetical protein